MVKEKIVLFGAGKYAEKVIDIVDSYFEIVAIVDNNSDVWGQMFAYSYPIISINEYKHNYLKFRILIAVEKMSVFLEIREQLNSMGIQCEHVNEAICEKTLEKSWVLIDSSNSELIEIIKNKNCAFVLAAPAHSNIGDQAQSFCISKILQKCYPNYKVLVLDEKTIEKNYYEVLYIIKNYIKDEDLLFLHSGYRLTNLYMTSEYIVEMIAKLFEDRKMIFLPQTIHYTDSSVEKNISSLIKENVLIMCRDEKSCENAVRIFPESRVELYPDVVTSLIGKYNFHNERKGILMVMRATDDGESLLDENDIAILKRQLSNIDGTDITDTTMEENWEKIAENRRFYIEREIEKYSKYKLIVTNRYHGTILALAANTPVVILPTKDHKISAGVKWFEEAEMENYVFCKDKSLVIKYAKELLEHATHSRNKTVFYDRYFSEDKIRKLFDAEWMLKG